MDQKIRNIVGGAIAFAVLAGGYASLSYVNSYGKSIQPSSFRSFSVSGDGKATAIPDVAEFSFQVITEGGNDLTSLQAKNTDAANKIIAFVKSEGVVDKDIRTQYYNVNPRYQNYNCRDMPVIMYNQSSPSQGPGGTSMPVPSVSPKLSVQACPPPSIVGYTVTQSVDVKMRDFKKIGDIIGGVVTNGANQVGSLSFTIDDPSKVQDQARAEAITKAKAKAEGVAQAGGFSVGRLLSVQEGGGYNPYVYESAMSAGKGGGATAPAPVIQPGSQDVTVTVTLVYEIE